MSELLARDVAYVLASCGARRKLARIKKQGLTSDILVYKGDIERLVQSLENEYPGLLDGLERRFEEAAKR